MPNVFDPDGNLIGNIPISAKQLVSLEAGVEVAVIFHTPQLLRYKLRDLSGGFSLHQAEGRIVTREPNLVKIFIELQQAIAAKAIEGESDAKASAAV